MTDYSYLDALINEVKELRRKTSFIEIDTSKCGISYMPTKKTSFAMRLSLEMLPIRGLTW